VNLNIYYNLLSECDVCFVDTKRITVLFILVIGITFSVFVPARRVGWGENDFLAYWSASKTMLSGGNPYEPKDLFKVQSAIRPELNNLSDLREALGPPVTMLMLSPLTMLDFEVSTRFWIFFNVLFLSIALYLLWEMLFDPDDGKSLILTFGVGFLFGNTIRLIELGQFSAVVLIAFVILIWCLNRGRYEWAGLVLFFLMIKPQITYLVIAVVFIWAIRNRKWRLFTGFFGSGLIFLALSWLLSPDLLPSFISAVISYSRVPVYYTTIGSLMESYFGISAFKYFGLVILLLSIPLSNYVAKAGWLTSLNIALVISIPFAPYGFSFDHILLLPAIVQLVSWICDKKIPAYFRWTICIGIVICYGLVYSLTIFPSGLPYYWLVWPSIGLGLLYLIAWWKKLATELLIGI